MTRRSGFGEVSKGAKIGIIVGVVVLIAVIVFFMFSGSSQSVPEAAQPEPAVQDTTNAAPVSFSITSGNTYQIKNGSTSQYLVAVNGKTGLSNNPSSTPWAITSSGNDYILTSNGLTLVVYGDISKGSINVPGVFTVKDPNPAAQTWNVNITNGNTVTIQNIAKINGGGPSWLSISNNVPLMVSTQDGNSTWTLE
jgi:hypothetical protein